MTRSIVFLGALWLLTITSGSPAQISTAPEAEKPVRMKALIAELGSEDLERREAAWEKIAGLGERARAALEEAARGADNREVKWNARLLLRHLGTHRSVPTVIERHEHADHDEDESEYADHDEDDGDDAMSTLEHRMKELQEIQRNLRAELEGMMKEFHSNGGFTTLAPELEKLRGRLHLPPELDKLRGRLRLPSAGEWRSLGRGDGASKSLELHIDENGRVHGKMRSGNDGSENVEEFTAENFEEFKRQHPELAERFGAITDGHGSFRFHWNDGESFDLGKLRRMFEEPSTAEEELIIPHLEPVEPPSVTTPAPEGERLGVTVSFVEGDAVKKFGVEDGQLLKVESVREGTLAEKAGMKSGDVIVKVNGIRIQQPDEVREALKADGHADKVMIVVGRDGEIITLTAERKAPAKPTRRVEKF